MALVVAVNKPATISSLYEPDFHQPSYAVDNVTVCSDGLFLAHSLSDFRPWIKIDLQDIYDINSVVIYNRQDVLGKYIDIFDHLSQSGALLE